MPEEDKNYWRGLYLSSFISFLEEGKTYFGLFSDLRKGRHSILDLVCWERRITISIWLKVPEMFRETAEAEFVVGKVWRIATAVPALFVFWFNTLTGFLAYFARRANCYLQNWWKCILWTLAHVYLHVQINNVILKFLWRVWQTFPPGWKCYVLFNWIKRKERGVSDNKLFEWKIFLAPCPQRCSVTYMTTMGSIWVVIETKESESLP